MRTIAAACLALAAAAAPAAAQTPEIALPQQQQAITGTVLTVSAEQRVSAKPDIAVINAGVTTQGATADAALADNAKRMTSLIAALRRAGVAERDIRTSQLSVNPQYAYQEAQSPRLTGYEAQNQVTAKIRDLNAVGRAVDAAVNAGGNQINGISFDLADPDTALDAARRDALKKARARADVYASAAGMKVVRMLQIQEGGGYTPPMPIPMVRSAMAKEAFSTPVQAGDIDLSATVNVVFELR